MGQLRLLGIVRFQSLRQTHDLPLLDQLGRVELGDDGLEDLVSDRREDSLVVVLAEVLVESRGRK